MSKDAAIAEIVRNLHTLKLEDNQAILKYIKDKQSKRERSSKSEPVHTDKDGRILEEGDSVLLLTKGVYNRKGEEGSVHKLPQTVGEYITFVRKREAKNQSYPTYLRKLGTSVRKIDE